MSLTLKVTIPVESLGRLQNMSPFFGIVPKIYEDDEDAKAIFAVCKSVTNAMKGMQYKLVPQTTNEDDEFCKCEDCVDNSSAEDLSSTIQIGNDENEGEEDEEDDDDDENAYDEITTDDWNEQSNDGDESHLEESQAEYMEDEDDDKDENKHDSEQQAESTPVRKFHDSHGDLIAVQYRHPAFRPRDWSGQRDAESRPTYGTSNAMAAPPYFCKPERKPLASIIFRDEASADHHFTVDQATTLANLVRHYETVTGQACGQLTWKASDGRWNYCTGPGPNIALEQLDLSNGSMLFVGPKDNLPCTCVDTKLAN